MSLSLYTIEDGLAELLEARVELTAEIARLESPGRARSVDGSDMADLIERKQELASVVKTLDEYQLLEVRKVDNCHHYLSSAKHMVAGLRAEAAEMSARASRIDAAMAWLKGRILEAMLLGKKKRVDGLNGRYLLRKGNGGIQKLQVDGWDEDRRRWVADTALPDDMKDVTVTMPLDVWRIVSADVFRGAEGGADQGAKGATIEVSTAPSGDRIREVLATPCARCGGIGSTSAMVAHAAPNIDVAVAPSIECPDCGGIGTVLVPGARLLPRGEHIEAK